MNKSLWRRLVRPQDFVWLLLLSTLAMAQQRPNLAEIELLIGLAVFQVAQPRFEYFGTERGNYLSIGIKLLIGFLLIGVTGGITSSYYLVLLLPVLSAATTLSIWGTLMTVLLACLSYLIFASPLLLDWSRYVITAEGLAELTLRVIFLPVVGFFTHQLADANRAEARKSQAVAAQLADANRSLQQAEAAVRRSERLAALGQLTAGLAHELRNPLGTIKASAEMLNKTLPEDNAVARELSGFISAEVDRTNSLVTRFLEFARPLKLRRKPAELGEIIDSAVAQMERHNPPFEISVHKNYAPDIRPLPLDAELMERVFYNLLMNAAQATAPGGTVAVKTRAAGEMAEVAVIDRGAGIDPAHRESIFNPFFTTKPDGVGLGLAIVSKIVDEHGGKMAVESEPGKGSIFRVFLPTHENTDSDH